MKKYFSLAAGIALLVSTVIGMSVSASAQTASGPFADVPADHWAYSAVNALQKNANNGVANPIVIGYPDGTFGGRRAMTRYEFAVAIARLLPQIQQQIDTSQFVKTSDFTAFQTDVNGKLQQEQTEIDQINALVATFTPELQALGQDVTAIKARLDADEQRLAAVEAEQRRVKITGEFNSMAEGNVNTNKKDAAPLDENGYRIGGTGNESIWNDINVYNDFLLTIDGRVSDSAHAIVKLDMGNYEPFLGSVTSDSPTRSDNGNTAGVPDVFSVYEAYVDMPVDLGVISSAQAMVGRFGEQFTPLTLKAINPDIYFETPETSSGDYTVDGAGFKFNVGPASVQAYAAQDNTSDWATMSAGPSRLGRSGPYIPGALSTGGVDTPNNPITHSAGARITYGNPSNWVIGVTGLIAGAEFSSVDPYYQVKQYPNNLYNNLAVYGADFNGTFMSTKTSALTLNGEFANSATGNASKFGSVNASHGTEAYDVNLGYKFGPGNIGVGYKDIYANFDAPGSWGQIGDYVNPTNIKGPTVTASYAFTPAISLKADGNFFEGQYNTAVDYAGPVGFAGQTPLQKGDDLNSYDVKLKYGFTKQYDLNLGYEWVQYKLNNYESAAGITAGNPTQQFITIGLGHQFTENASLKLMYQIINYNGDNTGFDPEGNKEQGGVATTQLSVKF